MKTRDAAHSCVDPHSIGSLFFVFPSNILGEINKLLKYYKYQLTKHCLEGRLEGFLMVSYDNVVRRIPNSSEMLLFSSSL